MSECRVIVCSARRGQAQRRTDPGGGQGRQDGPADRSADVQLRTVAVVVVAALRAVEDAQLSALSDAAAAPAGAAHTTVDHLGRAGPRSPRESEPVPQRAAGDEGDRAHGDYHRVLLRHVGRVLQPLRRLRMVSVSHLPRPTHDLCPISTSSLGVRCTSVSPRSPRSITRLSHGAPLSLSVPWQCPSATCPGPPTVTSGHRRVCFATSFAVTVSDLAVTHNVL